MTNNDEGDREKLRPIFLMIPRRLMISWLLTYVSALILIIGVAQYANYTDRQSNKRWCSLFNMYDKEYKENPPPTMLGQNIAFEISRMRNDWCK